MDETPRHRPNLSRKEIHYLQRNSGYLLESQKVEHYKRKDMRKRLIRLVGGEIPKMK